MPICCCIGEAAGTAAVAKLSNRDVKSIDIKSLQDKLEANGAVIR